MESFKSKQQIGCEWNKQRRELGVERAGTCAARTGARAAAVLAAPQSKFIRVSREQQIYCCLSRFYHLHFT